MFYCFFNNIQNFYFSNKFIFVGIYISDHLNIFYYVQFYFQIIDNKILPVGRILTHIKL